MRRGFLLFKAEKMNGLASDRHDFVKVSVGLVVTPTGNKDVSDLGKTARNDRRGRKD